MKRKIWCWFKKGLAFSLITRLISYAILIILAINLEEVTKSLSTLGFTAVILVIGITIIEGFLIEKIDKWQWANK